MQTSAHSQMAIGQPQSIFRLDVSYPTGRLEGAAGRLRGQRIACRLNMSGRPC